MEACDPHAREYAAAAAAIGELYGTRETFAVGDSLTICVPGSVNTAARVRVVEVLDESAGLYHVREDGVSDPQHWAITEADLLPF